jgi:D-alanyl-lipoteichoic acid acyltransferase DltB (MBOAT superfamily)
MTIASLPFLAFAAVAALFYNAARPLWWRQGVLLLANLYFLSTFSLGPLSYLPLAGFLGLSYAGALLLQRTRSPRLFWPVLVIVLGAFFWLKKYWFVSFVGFLGIPYVAIGLSYMLFRAVHVLMDAQAGTLPARISPLAYLNYLLNFTTLVSGPIQRYQDFAATQLTPQQPSLTWIDAGRAVERIALGFFKMIVLAAVVWAVHEQSQEAFAGRQSFGATVATALVLTTSYAVYLYFNFSGYTDIVIGVARFLRFELPENFNRPFSALNFLDFWARWHMSLSNWFKIYFYNPLVKALLTRFPEPAVEPFLGVAGFMITFFLIGLWHGQSSIFALYGLLLGLGVSVNKLYQIEMAKALGRKGYRALAANWLYQTFARGLTFTWFTMSLICFWSDWGQIHDLILRLGAAGIVALWLVMISASSLVLAAIQALRGRSLRGVVDGSPVLLSRYVRTVWVTANALTAVAALALLATPAPDVVYKVF